MSGETRLQGATPVRTFTQLFSSTPRGARVARRLVTHRMDAWGFAYGTEANENVTLIVAELAANAVRHGRVRGRDFGVRLVWRDALVGVEVLDARAERLPVLNEAPEEGGRGLRLVAELSEKWGVQVRPYGICKVVWAEVGAGRRGR